jgi:hypothetical protein
VETRREQKLDGRGRFEQESEKVYESYPGLPGKDRWERLISENGRPRAASDLEKELRNRQKKAEAMVREATDQPAKQQARQQREYATQRREFDAVLDDLFLVYNIRMERRELLDGHETIVFSMTPRREAKPRTREGSHSCRYLSNALRRFLPRKLWKSFTSSVIASVIALGKSEISERHRWWRYRVRCWLLDGLSSVLGTLRLGEGASDSPHAAAKALRSRATCFACFT